MSHLGPPAADGDPWQQLSGRASRLRVPKHAPLTRDGPFGRYRPAPEVIEHLLDDLEERMRNYFVLYNREREMRKEVEATAYRLEKELLAERNKVLEANGKISHLETKIKALIGQPLKIRETIEKIEVLYNQMDTLVQAFVGIGSCATLQSQNRITFLRLFLEYLYPCRDLDMRLNTLYTAIYSSLASAGALSQPIQLPEPATPMRQEPSKPAPPLRGLSITVHQLMLKVDGSSPEPGSYTCIFRYDHEPANSMDTNLTRVLKVAARPLDSASGVIDFNDCVEVHQLPPRIPNVIPQLIWDVYAGKEFLGSASVSIVDAKTLNARDPWPIIDAQGKHCGDVIVTLRGLPDGSKLPAVGFSRRNDELQFSSLQPAENEQDTKFVATVPDAKAQHGNANTEVMAKFPDRSVKAPTMDKGPLRNIAQRATTPPTGVPDEPFQPKHKAILRRPLFLKTQAIPKPTPLGGNATAPPTVATPKAGTVTAPSSARSASTPQAPEQPKSHAPVVEAKKAAPLPLKATLSKGTMPTMAVDEPLKTPAPVESGSATSPKVPPSVSTGAMEPKSVLKAPSITKAEPVTKSVPLVSKAEAATKGVPLASKAAPAPALTPKTAPPASTPEPPTPIAPKVAPKVTPVIAPKSAPVIDPKATGATEVKAPALAPKVAPKSTPAPPPGDAPESTPKTPSIAPKTNALTVVPKVTMAKFTPKLAPPASPSTTVAAAEEKKPLLPIVVKPKLLLKKPLAPKKA
ncbi:variable surface lipoprotein, putative [Babesia ovis]|uniref:Variable surface lipoprotein, putative n=1 Tax=Babesia ovis TaxID=5869 RepID=A0A9W5WUJ0_BABOV|nr:variable surface lipoprotein, putative [Babesia ovis]